MIKGRQGSLQLQSAPLQASQIHTYCIGSRIHQAQPRLLSKQARIKVAKEDEKFQAYLSAILLANALANRQAVGLEMLAIWAKPLVCLGSGDAEQCGNKAVKQG